MATQLNSSDEGFRKLDGTTSSMDQLALNNLVVSLRSTVKKCKVDIVHKLVYKIRNFRKKKGTEQQKVANNAKADRLGKEIEVLKKLTDDRLAKESLANTTPFSDLGKQPDPERRVTLRVACHSIMLDKVKAWREKHDDWPALAAFALYKNTGRRYKKVKGKASELNQKWILERMKIKVAGQESGAKSETKEEDDDNDTGESVESEENVDPGSDVEAAEQESGAKSETEEESDDSEESVDRESDVEREEMFVSNMSGSKIRDEESGGGEQGVDRTDRMLSRRTIQMDSDASGVDSNLEEDSGDVGDECENSDSEMETGGSSSENEVTSPRCEDLSGESDIEMNPEQSCSTGEGPCLAVDTQSPTKKSNSKDGTSSVKRKSIKPPKSEKSKGKSDLSENLTLNKEMVVKRVDFDKLEDDVTELDFLFRAKSQTNMDAAPSDQKAVSSRKKKDSFFWGGSDESVNDESDDADTSHDSGEEVMGRLKKAPLESTFVETLGHQSRRGQGHYRGQGHQRGQGHHRGQGHDRGQVHDRGQGHDRGRGHHRGQDHHRGQGHYRGQGHDRRGSYSKHLAPDSGRNALLAKPFKGASKGLPPNSENKSGFSREKTAAESRTKSANKRAAPETSERLHPSWAASKKRKEQSQIQSFQGRKTTFDD